MFKYHNVLMSVSVLRMLGSMHEATYLLLHNCIGLECDLMHALELGWHDENNTQMQEIDYFYATGVGVTGYQIWCNHLHVRKHVLKGWCNEVVTYM